MDPVNIQAIDKEITSGLSQGHKQRLLDFEHQIKVYRGLFSKFGRDWLPVQHWNDKRSNRSLLLMQRIIDCLTSTLYKVPPVRIVQNYPDASEFLDTVYQQNRMNSRWQAADKLCHAADFVAFQVVGSDDPNCPIRIHLWQSSNLVVYCSPSNPLKPVAVVTIDDVDEVKRYRLYTDEYVIEYRTQQPLPGSPSTATAPVRVKSEPNPYGILNFSFAHYSVPTIDFYSGGGIGQVLAEVNEHVNFRLSTLSDAMRYARPIAVLEGVHPDFTPPKWLSPGDWLTLPAKAKDARGEAIKPNLNFTAPPLEFVQREIDDLNNYIDLTLQTVGVPPAAIRLVQTTARSGASIVAEQIPLLLYAKARQASFAYYEEDLSRLILRVSIAHFGPLGVPTGFLQEALDNYTLVLRWGEVFPDLPGPDRDSADKWMIDNKLSSHKMVAMKRFDLSQEEADDYLSQIAEDEARLERLVQEKRAALQDVEPIIQPDAVTDYDPSGDDQIEEETPGPDTQYEGEK